MLSLAAYDGLLCSAGSDSRVCLWDLVGNVPVSLIHDHTDSVLAVRFDEKRLVSCSKGMSTDLEVVILVLTSA